MAVAKNTAVVQFATPTASWGTISHFGIWDSASGGTFLGSSPLDNNRAVQIGADVEFAPEALQVTVPRGEFTTAVARDMLAVVLGSSGNRHISLHTSAPGDAGTTGEVSTSGTSYARKNIAYNGWTITD